MLDLCSMAEKEGLTVGLIGGRRGVAVEALECLQNKYPNLKGWAMEEPETKMKNVDIIFVALGFPKQEYFINLLSNEAIEQSSNRALVLMAVGGTFDYLAGRSIRAPGWVRNIGLEWLYRLIHEPWRLPRQLEGGKFFLQVLTSK